MSKTMAWLMTLLLALNWLPGSSAVYADEMNIAIAVNIANPPIILSGPTANPNPAKTGDVIAFGVSATSRDNIPLSYIWDFGDGTTESDASVSHVYTREGAYAVSVTVINTQKEKNIGRVIVIVTNIDGGPALPPPPPLPWTVIKAQVSLNFKQPGRDKVQIAGILDLPAGWDPKDKIVSAGAGSNTVLFKLNAKGSGRTDKNAFLLSRKLKKKVFLGGPVKIKFVLRGDLAERLAGNGMTNATTLKTGVTVSLDALVTLDNQPYLAQVPLLWKAIANSGGKAKKTTK
ncbi:MAG: PKD domain-containing protein [Planctomycetota bacterium]